MSISPKFVRIIGSLFPLSYTISLLREILIGQSLLKISSIFFVFLVVNILIILTTIVVLKLGEAHLRKNGSIDFY
ncbi:hypothetical protein SP4011_09330 [Streptococcus parapneumoniae]|uniref:ABC transporter permease n=1 Tax=Streptococcus parapneumoniae TaxID=2993430 RepID=A0ABN6TJQ5_9STRE|nr:hypothetical protein SP4011_09330 [Streptococcus sp. SP4011]